MYQVFNIGTTQKKFKDLTILLLVPYAVVATALIKIET